MQTVDILILHGLVVTVDGDERIIEDGAVAISGMDIVAVGPSDEISAAYTATETIDASGQMVMPGLINAHTHAADSLFRGLVDDMPLEPWLERLWIAETRFVRPDTVRLGAQLAFAEMIRGGTTLAMDMFWFPEASAEAAREVGFRLMNGPIFFDPDGPDGIPAEQRTDRGREFMQEFRDDSLIIPGVLPHATYTVSPENLKQAQGLADEFGVFLSTHLSETSTEVATVNERFGQPPPQHLEDLGMLTERTVLAHCVHLSDDEIGLVTERGAVIAHCPVSNLKLGSGIAPVRRMKEAGTKLTLGTDGPVSSNDLDMWMAMRFAAVLHRGVHNDPTFLPAPDVVKMVTRDAARALGLADRVGSLEPGKRADVILIDLNRPHAAPLYDPYSHLVYTIGREDVSSVLINGQFVMRDRELLTLDEGAVIAEVGELQDQIAAYLASA